MLKRFVTDDPDKNGQNDTFGILSSESGYQYTNWFLQDSFGAAKAKYVNGELLPNYILPEYKEWLKFYRRLYTEKILDPEFIENGGGKMWEKAATKKYGLFYYFWGVQEYLSKGLSRDELVAVPPPNRADGSKAQYIYTSPNRHMMAITADSKNPEAVLKFFNWSCTEEGGVFLYAGVEGKDYDITNNNIVIRPDRRGKNLGWRQLTLSVEQPNVNKEPINGILAQSFGELGMEHLGMATRYGGYNELELYCPVFEELSQYDYEKLVSEFTDKAITGVIDIDAEWDNYVRNFRRSGGDRKIELSTKWYNETYGGK
jgi:putative aldouronate transport system substrate-binding protein